VHAFKTYVSRPNFRMLPVTWSPHLQGPIKNCRRPYGLTNNNYKGSLYRLALLHKDSLEIRWLHFDLIKVYTRLYLIWLTFLYRNSLLEPSPVITLLHIVTSWFLWSNIWQLKVNINKCNVLRIGKKLCSW